MYVVRTRKQEKRHLSFFLSLLLWLYGWNWFCTAAAAAVAFSNCLFAVVRCLCFFCFIFCCLFLNFSNLCGSEHARMDGCFLLAIGEMGEGKLNWLRYTKYIPFQLGLTLTNMSLSAFKKTFLVLEATLKRTKMALEPYNTVQNKFEIVPWVLVTT